MNAVLHPPNHRLAIAVMTLMLAMAGAALAVDADGDGVDNVCENCYNIPNVDQADADHNGIGDACETVSTTATNCGALKVRYR